jgi:hypothetical protein
MRDMWFRADSLPSPQTSLQDRVELRALSISINSALARATDHDTRAHLEGARDQIARILDPKFLPPMSAAPNGRGAVENTR